MSEEIDLESKFPDLRPINSSPSLGTLNGCGLMLYGGRDHDVETGTYIKTHCFTLIFVPILALRSFRVADDRTARRKVNSSKLKPSRLEPRSL